MERIPSHLKGKGIANGFSPPPRKRIRAPDLDTSALIEANSLTLMGRLTNPSVQRLWSLFPFLSNRWNLKGKAVGSDLGRGCFQFSFDFEEDMKKVLDNRPYHYDQWMVIIQQWEPVISESFPSQIPFWIEVQGLPKHYWQEEMLKAIGRELGQVMDTEISASSVKIQVLIDGLNPLIKDTMVDFPDGREALVTLEYKNLKNHCNYCHRLTHEKKACPGFWQRKTYPLLLLFPKILLHKRIRSEITTHHLIDLLLPTVESPNLGIILRYTRVITVDAVEKIHVTHFMHPPL